MEAAKISPATSHKTHSKRCRSSRSRKLCQMDESPDVGLSIANRSAISRRYSEVSVWVMSRLT